MAKATKLYLKCDTFQRLNDTTHSCKVDLTFEEQAYSFTSTEKAFLLKYFPNNQLAEHAWSCSTFVLFDKVLLDLCPTRYEYIANYL